MFDLNQFISEYVICRPASMFVPDIKTNDNILSDAIKDKSILVIGGAGSIGSSFIRAITDYEPAELYVVDTNENGLTELTRDLRSSECYVPPVYRTYPMDYSSTVFRKMFRAHERRNGKKGFDIVANFSAHKHVRSEKDIYSIEALLRNNVIHAMELLGLLEQYPPEVYFCVSTDKAANPVNIMGASKRIMEDLIFSYSDSFPVKTARFANVAFSQGSLPDGFLHRLEKYQPLTAPADVERYFVSPEESGQICMLAAMLGNNREIFFPKLEPSSMMGFKEIAQNLLIAYGLRPLECDSEEEAIAWGERIRSHDEDDPYPVYFSPSDTSGEKSFEEFYTENETVDLMRYQSLGVIMDKEIPDRKKVEGIVHRLTDAFKDENTTKETIVSILSDYLPEFKHIETGKSLDDKM